MQIDEFSEIVPTTVDPAIRAFLDELNRCADIVGSRREGKRPSWGKIFPNTQIAKNPQEYMELSFGGPPQKAIKNDDLDACLAIIVALKQRTNAPTHPLYSIDIDRVKTLHAAYAEAMRRSDGRKIKTIIKPANDAAASRNIIQGRIDALGFQWKDLQSAEVFGNSFVPLEMPLNAESMRNELRTLSALCRLLQGKDNPIGLELERRIQYLSQVAQAGAYLAHQLDHRQIERQMIEALISVHKQSPDFGALERILITSSYYAPTAGHVFQVLDLPPVIETRFVATDRMAPRLLNASLSVVAAGAGLYDKAVVLKGRTPNQALLEARARAVANFQRHNIDYCHLFLAMDTGDLDLAQEIAARSEVDFTFSNEASVASLEVARGELKLRLAKQHKDPEGAQAGIDLMMEGISRLHGLGNMTEVRKYKARKAKLLL